METLPLKVASRFLFAAFIPDSWFKDQKDKLLKVLKSPMHYHGPADVQFELRDRLISFFYSFQSAFDNLVSQDWARTSIKDRVEFVTSYLQKMIDTLQPLVPIPDAKGGAEGELTWAARSEIENAFKEKVSNLADAIKYSWSYDKAKLTALIQKTLRAMTPEIREMFEVPTDRNFGPRNDFIRQVRFYESARRLLKREKLELDLSKWVDRVYEVLKANFTDKAIQEQDGFQKFDMYGMKIVVDDRNLRPEDIKKYIKYIDEAYHRLKAKGFQKVWYGTIFIQCASCGGVNHNTGGGVGGNYHIGEDVVNVFSRPSSFITFLLAHELGHRYWFRTMKGPQKERFKDLVHVRNPNRAPPPNPQLISDDQLGQAKGNVDRSIEDLRGVLRAVQSSKLKWNKIVPTFAEQVAAAGMDFSREKFFHALHSLKADTIITPEVNGLFKDALAEASKVMQKCLDFGEDLKTRINRIPDGETNIGKWEQSERLDVITEIRHQLDVAVTSAYVYLDAAVAAFNQRELDKQKQYEEQDKEWNERGKTKVAPVSDYGKSNIDEAFAEAFAHYILGEDMTQDQVESFRTVLSSTMNRVALAVLNRYLRGAIFTSSARTSA